MARYGGYQGGMPNMNNLMKQYQKMQRKLEETQEELSKKEYLGESGGAVKVTVSGEKKVLKVEISPEAVDPEDVETLEDMILASTNQALEKAEEESKNELSKFTGGLGF